MISSLLIKPAGADCNMACRYCFYRPKAALYPDASHPRMPAEVLRELVRQYMALAWRHEPDHASDGPEACAPGAAAFCWQGGEPTLMGLDFYRQAVALQQKFGHAGQVVGNSLQTNGLLINDEWARFMGRYRFLIGLSLDGPPEVHDHYRINLGGESTHRQVVRAWRILQSHQVETNILCLATSHSAGRAALILEYLYDLGARFMQFIPCLEQHSRTGQPLQYSVTPEQYGDFLCDLFEAWRPHQQEVSVRLFDDIMLRLTGHGHLVSCEFRPNCGEYVVVEHNGDIYACDFFVDVEHRLGNIVTHQLSDVSGGQALAAFASDKSWCSPECQECNWLDFCQSGCPKHRLFRQRVEGGEAARATYLCDAYRRFFAHALPQMRIIAQELSPGLQGTGTPQ